MLRFQNRIFGPRSCFPLVLSFLHHVIVVDVCLNEPFFVSYHPLWHHGLVAVSVIRGAEGVGIDDALYAVHVLGESLLLDFDMSGETGAEGLIGLDRAIPLHVAPDEVLRAVEGERFVYVARRCLLLHIERWEL